MLGYRFIDGDLVVIPEEAAIVRQIFADYLSGMGQHAIAKKLILQGVQPDNGNTWSRTSIRKILTNEKYTGNMVLQKTFCPDFRAKRSQTNRGERPVYHVSNSHEAIIDQETFDAAQAELQARAIPGNRKGAEIIRPYHLFHGLIRCGCCGRLYGYHRTNAKQYDKAVWVCPNFYSFGKAVCPSQKIPEDILISKTKEVLEVDQVDRGLLEQRIKEIFVPENNHLTFILRDESEVDVFWEHPSRSLSWTPEMKQRARERILQRYHKEEQ